MSKTSRRAILAGIATAPFFAAPAVITMPAVAGAVAAAEPEPPAPIAPAIVLATDPRLLALRDELKPLMVQHFELEPKFDRAYEAACKQSRFNAEGLATEAERLDFENKRWPKACKQTGYRRLSDQVNKLFDQMTKISKRILKIPATDRICDGIHAAAAPGAQ
jgi:hypothetical protein